MLQRELQITCFAFVLWLQNDRSHDNFRVQKKHLRNSTLCGWRKAEVFMVCILQYSYYCYYWRFGFSENSITAHLRLHIPLMLLGYYAKLFNKFKIYKTSSWVPSNDSLNFIGFSLDLRPKLSNNHHFIIIANQNVTASVCY